MGWLNDPLNTDKVPDILNVAHWMELLSTADITMIALDFLSPSVGPNSESVNDQLLYWL